MSYQRKVMLIFLFLFFLQNGFCSILKTEERRFSRDLTMFTENRPKPVYSGYRTGNQEQANSEETSSDTSVRTGGKVAYISFGGFKEAEQASNSSEDQEERQLPREAEAEEPIKSFRSEKEEEFSKKNSEEAMKGARREKDLWNNGNFIPADRKWPDNSDESSLFESEQGDVSVTCFSAVRASRESQDGRKGRILLENTFANVNQGWSSHESIFLCNDPGLYSFSFSARGQYSPGSSYFPSSVSSLDGFNDVVNPENVNIIEVLRGRRNLPVEDCFIWIVSLMLNGQAVVSVGGGNDTSASNSILLPVQRGDRVWLQLNRGKLVEILPDKGGLTSFTGYRLADISPNTDTTLIESRGRPTAGNYLNENFRARQIQSREDIVPRSGGANQDQGSNWITGVRVDEPRPYFPIRPGQSF